jgi:hypothetical protein
MQPARIAIPLPFRYDARMCPGESLGRHQHYGFWTRSNLRLEVFKAGQGSGLSAKRGWQGRWETREEWLKAAKT